MRKLSAALAIVFVAGAVSFAGGSVGATNINAPIKLKKVTAGLDNPVALAWRGNDAGTIYVAEQTGSVVIVKQGNILGTVLKLNGISVAASRACSASRSPTTAPSSTSTTPTRTATSRWSSTR
jgi:hypothetical protein